MALADPPTGLRMPLRVTVWLLVALVSLLLLFVLGQQMG
jgi:hypothetical protein